MVRPLKAVRHRGQGGEGGGEGGKTLGHRGPLGHFSDCPPHPPPKPGQTALLHTLEPLNRRFQTRSFGKINAAAVFRVFRQLPGNTYSLFS